MSNFYYQNEFSGDYTQWISSCFAAAREFIPGNIDNRMFIKTVTGVNEGSQQRNSLKDEGYITNRTGVVAQETKTAPPAK